MEPCSASLMITLTFISFPAQSLILVILCTVYNTIYQQIIP